MFQQQQMVQNTQTVSRASSLSVSEATLNKNNDEQQQETAVNRPSLLRVPSVSNQDFNSTNNNDVSTFIVSLNLYLTQ